MHLGTWQAIALALLATFANALVSSATSAQSDDMRALDGEWTFVEDLTEGRALEMLGPPMSSVFALRVEEGAMILVHGHGSGHRNVRLALDGTVTEVTDGEQTARYRGEWKDGAFTSEVDFVRKPGQAPEGLIRREFRLTPDGLIVRFRESVALYRHAEDIPMPTPAKAVIDDVKWLAGAWVGTRGTGGSISFEERWTEPSGGAMLAVSRTVSRGKMSAFEYLRLVERDGGLVYVAQPGGAPPTEFVLTELDGTRAVFANPRHDYPKRIVYELAPDGRLTATIGQMKGGTPRRFEFSREEPGK